MQGPTHFILLAALFFAVSPLAVLAHRWRLLKRPWGRWGLGLLAIVIVAVTFPETGLGLESVKRLKLLLLAALLALLAARLQRLGVLGRRRNFIAALTVLALAAVVVDLDFFDFHGRGTWMQQHDVAHYYLGSKYFEELGYENLYGAMLRAEAELYGDRFITDHARDLSSHEIVHIRPLLEASGPVKAAFSEKRWEAFSSDVRFFRETLGPNYARVLTDHGFNATPLWAAIGGFLGNRVPEGNGRAILLLTFLDPLLLVLLFAALGRVWGSRVALLALLFYALAFGAGFSWTGGGFLRTAWLASSVLGLACLERRRHGWAGAFLALAALLRIFPIFFLAGPAFRALGDLISGRGLSAEHRKLFISFGLSAALLLLASGAALGGFDSWSDFGERSTTYRETVSPNQVGLTRLLAPDAGRETGDLDAFRSARDRRNAIYRFQLWSLFPLALLALAWASRRRSDTDAAALGWLPIFAGMNLASYYCAGLLLLIPAGARRPERLLWLFGGEAMLYALRLFESSQALLFVYRSLGLLYLLVWILLERPIPSEHDDVSTVERTTP